MRVTKTAVIQAASDIADEKGLNNVSLKVVAERLNIRTPSLYNHIENLDDLLREVAHNGMRTINQRMTQAAIGKSGDTAIKAIAIEYLNYMISGKCKIEHCCSFFKQYFSSVSRQNRYNFFCLFKLRFKIFN